MQTFKERPASKHHQRSQSLLPYDELRRRTESNLSKSDTEFRQRRPLLDPEPSVDGSSQTEPTESHSSNETTALTSDYVDLNQQEQPLAVNKLDTEKNLLPDITCLLEPGPSTSTSNVPVVKGHRRSLSLRQRFEVGYDFIATEFEHARKVAGETVIVASETVWKVCQFQHLPNWMQDNEYIHCGHRPPLPSLWACAKSVFRIHSETGNIWTHGIGALFFLALMVYEFVTISAHKTATDKLMLAIYFCGIILCLIFSTLFHTFSCYASPRVTKMFSKLDYCGISLQIIGSMTPALYYGFYEDFYMFAIYISFGFVLCIFSIIVSMWDKFGEPKYRSLRAIVFLTFGLSNVIPGVHWYIVLDSRLYTAFGLFILQGAMYVFGALLYANRIPERIFPGKCDYLFQSHQIFHVLIVLAALVHLNGINLMANFHMSQKAATAAATIFTNSTRPLT